MLWANRQQTNQKEQREIRAETYFADIAKSRSSTQCGPGHL
jgi:hypothetical protein